jgi:hypothetical protein
MQKIHSLEGYPMRGGYWSLNEYHRLNVKDYVEEFCGWKALTDLSSCATPGRDQAFLATLFLTGGRVSETLALKRENFEVRNHEGIVLVRNMPLLKRYKKLSETVNEEGKKGWITEKLSKNRKPFPIIIREPLAPIFLDYLGKAEGLLFPSPYKKGFPLSRFWAYKLIRKIDDRTPESLKEELGLNKPFVKNGEEICDRIHLWLHWFRSQRASQLVSDYGYEVIDLIDFFSWERYDTALTYARKGWRGLASKMQVAQVAYV